MGPPTPVADEEDEEPAAGEPAEAAPAAGVPAAVLGWLYPPPAQAAGEPAAADELPEDAHPAEEARAARPARDPGAPTQAERDAHASTHLPFRSWCDECVHGRRDAPPHFRTKRAAGEVPG